MKSVDNLVKLAERFARKISLAQQTAQPGEIVKALQDGGVWGKPEDLFPLADQAGLPQGPCTFNFTVDKNLNTTFHTVCSVKGATPASQIKMNSLLKNKYNNLFKTAMQKAGLSVADTMDVKWHVFT